MRFPVTVTVLISMTVGASCKRKDPVAAAPAAPAATTPRPMIVPSARASLTVDGAEVTFPPVQMHVSDPGEGAAVTLATVPTNDPDDNLLSLDMTLPDADPGNLDGAEWHFKSDDNERAVTLNTIVLHGGDVELQPADLRVTFQRDGNVWFVTLDGECYLYEGADALEPRKKVVVAGRVRVGLLK